ncbi:MAG: NAD-dependent epimerase/dehydratase [Lachnospiraceae bacterium]|nr:NAD-dependent epimerase/dehydratase [Lachnospiraceae bacterium]
MRKATITGATGMIGMALAKELLRKGIEVVCVIRPDSGRLKGFEDEMNRFASDMGMKEKLHIALLNLSDYGKTESVYAMEDVDAFFHLAWEGTYGNSRNDEELQKRNTAATLEAVWLAYKSGASVFVGAGSQAEYGRVPDGVKLSAYVPTNPENEYGKAKLRAGIDSRAICKSLGMRHVWARILSVYGPGDGKNTMVMSGINKLINGEKPQYTKAEQQWDYLYAEDAARALFAMADKGIDGKIYPIGSGQTKELREYIEIIRDVVSPGAEIGIGELPYNEGQVMYLCADITELTEDTGFIPQVSFKDGIEKTLDYVRGQLS